MIYPVTPIIIKNIRGGRQTLWTMCLCLSLALSACNSSSSNDDSESVIAQTFMSDSQDAVVSIADGAQDSGAASNDEINSEDGTSLLSAAKSDTKPIDKISQPSSILQATLIGDYAGIMPCSFCDNTEVVLNLHSDGTTVKTSTYKNPDLARAPLIENGIYRQSDDMITIAYTKDKIENYRIQGNHLVLVDANKTLNTDYTFSRR